MEAEALRRSLAQRNAQLEELEQQIQMWMQKNDAKQEVRSDSTLISTAAQVKVGDEASSDESEGCTILD